MSEIIVEKAGKVVSVVLDRPPVNALTMALYQRIAEVFEDIGKLDRRELRGAVGGGSRAFCAGLDLRELLAAKVEDDPGRAVIVRRMFRVGAPLRHSGDRCGQRPGARRRLRARLGVRHPHRSENATFGLPEINAGRCGGTAHMARHVPQGLLRRMFFTGTPFSAQEAYRVGFVEQVVPLERLLPAANELAGVIAGKAPLGLRWARKQ